MARRLAHERCSVNDQSAADSSAFPTSNPALIQWLRGHRVDEVECLVPDLNGVMRGKIVPREEFISALDSEGLRMPEAVLVQSVTGDYDYEKSVAQTIDADVRMIPDPSSVRLVPWYDEPVAQIICDVKNKDGELVDFAARSLLKNILAKYTALGLKPIVAPELEFYLVEKNIDPDLKLVPPVGLTGRREAGRQPYGIEAANDFDPVVNRIYDYAEVMHQKIGTMAHEQGPAQLEINCTHGDALELADQVFLFKRMVRQAAMKDGMYATFMAMPHQDEPGSAMHVHQSLVDIKTGRNIFADEKGEDTPALYHYIGGLQKHLAAVTPLMYPNVNSFRRMRLESDAPINLHWGRDNRTCGLRVPHSSPNARRVENRLPGVDSNPYLAFAATLACGLIGLIEKIEPEEVVPGDAHELPFTLPRYLPEALARMAASDAVRAMLGSRFVDAFVEVKSLEIAAYNKVISSWEREHLLLSV